MKKTVIIILSVLLAVALAGCIYHFVLLRDARTENVKQTEALGAMKLTADDNADTIAALTATLKEREDALAALTAALEQLKKENAALSAAAKEKDSQVAALDQDAQRKNALAEEKAAAYDALNEQYAALLKESDEQAAQLNQTIKAREDELAALKAQADESAAQIGELNTTVAENAQTIEVLQADVEAKKSEIEAKAAQIEALNAAVAQKEETIGTLNADVAVKKGEIEEKTAQIAQMSEHAESKKSEIEALNDEITALNAAIGVKEQTIEALGTDVEAKKGEIEALNTEIGTLNAAVKEKEETIAALSANVDPAEHAQKLAEIETLTAAGKEKDQTIEALNADVAAKAQDIKGKAAEIDALTAAGTEKDQTIEALNADITAKDADIEGKIAEIDTLTAVVAAREQTIQENETKIDTLTAAIAARELTIKDNEAQIGDLKTRLNIKNPLDAYDIAALDETSLYGRAARLMENQQWKEAQTLLLSSTDEKSVELLKTCNAQCFLADLQAGLKERWALAGEDTSVMSNEKTVAYYTALVNAELNRIGMYASLTLDDEQLTAYAGTYISALNNQLVGIEEFFSKDLDRYYRYWQEEGYNRRAQILFLLNREYGLSELAGSAPFKDMVNTGEHINLFVMAERSLAPQILSGSFKLINANQKRVTMNPFTLTNTSGCTLESVTLKMHLYDAAGAEVSVLQLYYGDNLLPGAKLKTAGKRIDTPFARYAIECLINIKSAAYQDSFSFTVAPLAQFGWNGEIVNAPAVEAGTPEYAIENVHARWTTHTAWGAASYVPSLQFDVRNIGAEKSGEVVIRCEFVNEANQTIWSEETSYVTGPNDVFLNPDDSKRAFLYSSVGYGEALNAVALADVSANVYINGVFVENIKIEK